MKNDSLRWTVWLGMALVSILVHVLHWVAYEFTAFSLWFAAVTPLVICLIYHLFQSDCEETFRISRRQVFIGTVIVPLAAALIVSLLIFVNNPNLGLYAVHGQLTGSFIEKIGLYSGRIIISGVYLLIFSAIDIPLLRIQDERRYLKKSAELTEEDLQEKQVYTEPVFTYEEEHQEDEAL